METNLSSCLLIQFLEQLLKFLVNFTLLKYVKSERSYGFLITKKLIFGFQILDLKDHFSASLNHIRQAEINYYKGTFYNKKNNIKKLREHIEQLLTPIKQARSFKIHQ